MKENFGLKWLPFHVERYPDLYWKHVRFSIGISFSLGVLNIILSLSISNYLEAPSISVFKGVVPDIFLERYAMMLERGAVDSISYLLSLLSLLVVVPLSTRWHYAHFFPSCVLRLRMGQPWGWSLFLVVFSFPVYIIFVYVFIFDTFLTRDRSGGMANFLLNFPVFCFMMPLLGVFISMVVLNVVAFVKMFDTDRRGED